MLSDKDLAILVDDKNAAGGPLGSLFETDGADQSGGRIAQKLVGQVFVLLE